MTHADMDNRSEVLAASCSRCCTEFHSSQSRQVLRNGLLKVPKTICQVPILPNGLSIFLDRNFDRLGVQCSRLRGAQDLEIEIR